MINVTAWHKSWIAYFQQKAHLSDYGLLWIAFIKGLLIGLYFRWYVQDEITKTSSGHFKHCHANGGIWVFRTSTAYTCTNANANVD